MCSSDLRRLPSVQLFPVSAGPFVRGSWPKNRKVMNESLSARSVLSVRGILFSEHFDGFGT